MSTCPLCKEPIEANQSRVCVFYDVRGVGDKHTGSVAYCHRKCAAEMWPEFYQWHPPPKRPESKRLPPEQEPSCDVDRDD